MAVIAVILAFALTFTGVSIPAKAANYAHFFVNLAKFPIILYKKAKSRVYNLLIVYSAFRQFLIF